MASGYRLTGAGVAVVLMAATLSPVACRDGTSERGGRARRSEAGRGEYADAIAPRHLEARWLVAPDVSGEPPLAAPLALAVDEYIGRLYLLETQPPELRVYDLESGVFLDALGRAGDGPGEYRRPIALAVETGGGLAAVLSMSGRVTFWRTDGGLAGTVRIGPGLATDIVAARADSFYVKSDVFPPADVAEFRVVAVDTALERPRFRDLNVPGTEEPGRPYRNHSYAVAATPAGDLLLAPPGPEYTILRVGAGGDVLQQIGRPEVTPLARSEEEIEAIRERVRRAFAALGRAAPQGTRVPRYRSHVARLAAAPDASIWALTQRGDSSAAIIDWFDADGVYSGSVVVDLRVSELAVSSTDIYLLARSRFDLPGVAVARRPGR
ncbi:MAG: hypothetical protein GTO46_11165 [Gemmatimonadetes bacterium]|nr:hypothetical protein [Gemmatimonadota bacterium]NIO32161.1 hypothetical protein [Gemmatimonadota bacterium]